MCCLFVVLDFWYTCVVSNVFLRDPKTESDFRCTEKLAATTTTTTTATTTTATTTTTTTTSDTTAIHISKN